MNQENQGTNPFAPLKRKRGRPRKFPIMDPRQSTFPMRYQKGTTGGKAPSRRNEDLEIGENAQAPPGFAKMNNKPWQVDQAENNILVGQVVSGVVEAVFDAGCLLSVKVGNSDTTLRGVVFKPGHYVPVSAENDVAPHLQMIRRNYIPFSAVNYSQAQCRKRRTRKRYSCNGGTTHPANGTSLAKSAFGVTPNGASAGISINEHLPPVSQTVNVARGKLVPVVLVPQSARLSNWASSSDQFQSQASHKEKSTDTHNEKSLYNHPSEAQNDNDTKSVIASGMPFQKLLTEVMKRAQSPSKSGGSQGEIRKSYAPESESGGTLEGKDRESPLLVAPLQAVEPTEQNYSATVPNSKPLEYNRSSKMTTLLQVLQEKMAENQTTQTRKPVCRLTDSRLKSDECGPDAEYEDKGTDCSSR